MPRYALIVAGGLVAIVIGSWLVGRAQAGDGHSDSIDFGGSTSDGGTVYIEGKSNYTLIYYLEIRGIKVQSPPCDDGRFDIYLSDILVTNYEFTFHSPAGTVHGNLYTLPSGVIIIDGTVNLDPPCEAHVTFHAETRATLPGDFDCSLGNGSAPLAGSAVPQGQARGTAGAITVSDLIAFFEYFIFGPASLPTPQPTTTTLPGGPLTCSVPGTLTPTGAIDSDFNCDHEVTYQDILLQLQHIGGLSLQDPVPAPDCVPIGHFYNVSQ